MPFACFTVAAGHIIIMPADWDISAWSVHDPVVDSVPTRYIEPMLDQCRPAVYDVGPTLTNIGSMSRVCWGTVRRNVTDVGATRHDPCTVTYSKRPHFATNFFFRNFKNSRNTVSCTLSCNLGYVSRIVYKFKKNCVSSTPKILPCV